MTNEYREPRGHVTLTSKHYDKSPVKPSFQHLPTGLTASKALRCRRRRRRHRHFHSAAAAVADAARASVTTRALARQCTLYVCASARATVRRPGDRDKTATGASERLPFDDRHLYRVLFITITSPVLLEEIVSAPNTRQCGTGPTDENVSRRREFSGVRNDCRVPRVSLHLRISCAIEYGSRGLGQRLNK